MMRLAQVILVSITLQVLLAGSSALRVQVTEPRPVLFIFGQQFRPEIYVSVKPALEQAGYRVVVASRAATPLKAKNEPLTVPVDILLKDVRVVDYSSVLLNCDNDITFGSARDECNRIVREAIAEGVVVGAICSGPRVLVAAGVVAGKTMTGEPSQTCGMLRTAGAACTGRAVERDGLLITARDCYCGPAFAREVVSAMQEHPRATSGLTTAIVPGNVESVGCLSTLSGHTARIPDVAFSRDARLLASSAYDQTVRLWDVASGRELHEFRKASNAAYENSLSFSPDGRLVATSHGVWETGTYSLVLSVPPDTLHVRFSPDGDLLALDAIMRPVYLLETQTWAHVCAFESLQSTAPWADDSFGFEFSPDGDSLAAGGRRSGVARVFGTATGRLMASLLCVDGSAEADVHDVAFSADGTLLAAAGTGAEVRIFRMPGGEMVRRLITGGGTMSLDFSADGQLLAVSTGGVVNLWDVETGQRLRSLTQASAAMSVAFSDDGRLLACGLYDGTITLWGIDE